MNQEVKKTLWAAADTLRPSLDAAEYRHIRMPPYRGGTFLP